jgi:AcrR family transcriptional regulator
VTRHDVLVAALDLIDRDGLDDLSMRKLAAELGIETMSLYKRVASKDDLLTGIAELIWEEVAAASAPTDDWGEWLRSYGHAIRSTVRKHPNAVPLLVGIDVLPPAMLEVCATQLERSSPGWPPSQDAVGAMCTVTAFALGTAIADRSFASTFSDESDGAQDPITAERQRLRRVARALPADASDRVVDTAMAVCGCDVGDMFAKGLDLIVRGCEQPGKR